MPKPNRPVPQTGSQSANFHEGTRSEYLAHYVFSSFGTCVPVPHPEDTGIDLHCTLTETIGQRIWPVGHYFVQVKSMEGPWVFSSKRSVEQFFKIPVPVFFCIVTKKELRLRVYGTQNCFSILKGMPEELYLFPGDVSKEGARMHDETNRINLGPPILNFTLNEIVDESFAGKAKEILRRCSGESSTHILLRKIGVPVFTTSSHTTNEVTTSGSRGVRHLKSTPEQKRVFDYVLREMLSWLQSSMGWANDTRGHWRIGLFRHHLESDGAAGKLRKRGQLYETMLNYLRGQRRKNSDDAPSPTNTLDTILDDIIQALITEHLEHTQRIHERSLSRDDEWEDEDEEEDKDEDEE